LSSIELTDGKGGGTKLYDGEKAWPSIMIESSFVRMLIVKNIDECQNVKPVVIPAILSWELTVYDA
jgi:hypothetical protein